MFYTANIDTFSIYLYMTVFIDIGQSSLDVYAIACVFTYGIASVFTYIMHYCRIILIYQLLLNTENNYTNNNLLTNVYYLLSYMYVPLVQTDICESLVVA